MRTDVGRSHVVRGFLAAALFSLSAVGVGRAAVAAEPKSRVGPDPQQFERVVSRGIKFLATQGQAEDGSYSKQAGVGVTALAATALLRSGRTVDDPLVASGIR